MTISLTHPNRRTFKKTANLSGTVRVPGDKSMTHRAILFALLAEGTTRIEGWLNAADCRSSLEVAKQLGASVSFEQESLLIKGTGGSLKEPENVLDCGNSGTTIRLFSGAIASQVSFACLTGDDSLRRRPMGRVLKPLAEMGAIAYARSGSYAPFALIGQSPLSAIRYTLPVPSAQVKSAVMLAGLHAPKAGGVTTIIESQPSRDHTERMLLGFGVQVDMEKEGEKRYISIRAEQPLRATSVEIPGDASSAAFLLVAAAIVPDSDVTIEHVGLNPTRIGFLKVLQRMGAHVEILNQRESAGEPLGNVRVRYQPLSGTDILPEEIPSLIDEIPILAVAAAVAEGKTTIRGAGELRVKETDRILAMAKGLQTLGVHVEEADDGLTIIGGKLNGGVVDSFHDHRIAMSFAVAGLAAEQEVTIENWSAVDISFPTFSDLILELQRERKFE